MSKKREAINKIFQRHYSKKSGNDMYEFHNDEVKEVTANSFRNQFDATKFDSSEKLPSLLKENGYFIIHLGNGKHAFVKGEGFHKLEIKDICTGY